MYPGCHALVSVRGAMPGETVQTGPCRSYDEVTTHGEGGAKSGVAIILDMVLESIFLCCKFL